jgi:hypothetical protein
MLIWMLSSLHGAATTFRVIGKQMIWGRGLCRRIAPLLCAVTSDTKSVDPKPLETARIAMMFRIVIRNFAASEYHFTCGKQLL